jgi:hypothetical protein|nr:MAG TPA: DNA packaging protein [Caudoviricetes sp.]
MILTKEEFEKQYNFNSQSGVCRIIREKKIRLNKDGMIDTSDEYNIPYCTKREERIKKQQNKQTKEKVVEEIKTKKNQKSADEIALSIDLLNARLDEKRQRSELMRLKIAKEQNEVIETEVLNRCIQEIFSDMIKNLTELPNIYANDLIKIVQSEEQPKEIIVEFLTQKITSTLKLGLTSAKTATKKYYEGDYDNDIK